MFLHATRREFDRGYIANIQAARGCASSPENLLLVYGLECGMKALIMKEQRAEITSELPLIADIGHDLRECLKALHAPPTLTLRTTKTAQRIKQTVPNPLLHQALRYGIEVEDRANVIMELKKVHEWLIERSR